MRLAVRDDGFVTGNAEFGEFGSHFIERAYTHGMVAVDGPRPLIVFCAGNMSGALCADHAAVEFFRRACIPYHVIGVGIVCQHVSHVGACFLFQLGCV